MFLFFPSSPPKPIPWRLTLQLQTFCGEKKVIQYSCWSFFVSLWIWKYGGHLFRACCWISTCCRMFAILSRRIKVVFSQALKSLSILLSSLHFKMSHSFVVPSDLFHCMFWRENIHTQGGILCTVQNTMHLQNNRYKKNNFVVFSSIEIQPVFIIIITTSAWPQVQF